MPLTTYKGPKPKIINKIYQVTFCNGVMYWSNIHHTPKDAKRDAAEKLKLGYTEVKIRVYKAPIMDLLDMQGYDRAYEAEIFK